MTKSSHREGIRLARELISIAREDFDTAKHLFGVGRFRWGLIALQQSLEKVIKALISFLRPGGPYEEFMHIFVASI
jgi:HEPN domain-containing protein